MNDTTFFVQCANCENCTEAVLGYYCEKHCMRIDNPRKDGCIGDGMKHISYEERARTYTNALIAYGDRAQMVVALEELAECQQTICKVLRGDENLDHLAEEIADATIMLEQMRLMFGINEAVAAYMDRKVQRLDERLRKDPGREH